MKQKKITYYQLEKHYGISTNTLRRLRRNQNISTYTLNKLCYILTCGLPDMVEFREVEGEERPMKRNP